jgi:hypothetical protein
MYVSRLNFRTIPGHTGEAEQELKKLQEMVAGATGARPRILRSHFASLGAPDVVFEQEALDLAALDAQVRQITESPDFQRWSAHMSGLLAESPKREIFQLVEPGP